MTTELDNANPLMQVIELDGREYITSYNLHTVYKANAGEKYSKLKNFNRLIRNIETFNAYKEKGDIVEIKWDVLTAAKYRGSKIESLIISNSYNPIMLISKTIQVALSHHLDDAISKEVSMKMNEAASVQKFFDFISNPPTGRVGSKSEEDVKPKKITARVLKGAISMGDQFKEIRKKHGDDPVVLALLSDAIGLNITALATVKPKTVIPGANGEYIPSDDDYLRVTDLGKMFTPEISGQAVNKILQNVGFLTKEKGSDDWVITADGAPYGKYFYSQHQTASGLGNTRHVRWVSDVLEHIDPTRIKSVI